MLLLDGKPIIYGKAFTHEGIQYPSNWLTLASKEEWARLGIEEIPDPRRIDARFELYIDDEGTVSYRNLLELKHRYKAAVKAEAGAVLSGTDWMVVRYMDINVPIPPEVQAYRQSVREYCDTKVQLIDSFTDVPSLKAFVDSPEYSFMCQADKDAHEAALAADLQLAIDSSDHLPPDLIADP